MSLRKQLLGCLLLLSYCLVASVDSSVGGWLAAFHEMTLHNFSEENLPQDSLPDWNKAQTSCLRSLTGERGEGLDLAETPWFLPFWEGSLLRVDCESKPKVPFWGSLPPYHGCFKRLLVPGF